MSAWYDCRNADGAQQPGVGAADGRCRPGRIVRDYLAPTTFLLRFTFGRLRLGVRSQHYVLGQRDLRVDGVEDQVAIVGLFAVAAELGLGVLLLDALEQNQRDAVGVADYLPAEGGDLLAGTWAASGVQSRTR